MVVSGAMTLWIGPVPTLIIVTLWEPIEVFVLSPILSKAGITFGYETLRNSLSDTVFNCIGVLGALLLI